MERIWRDNRLNPIHEGTNGIQAADLLGRKVRMEGGRGMQLLAGRTEATISRACSRGDPELAGICAGGLRQALQDVRTRPPRPRGPLATRPTHWPTRCPTCRRSATPSSRGSGSTSPLAVLSGAGSAAPAQQGRLHAARFYRYELPKIGAWLRVVETRDPTCAHMPEEAF